MVVQLVTQPVIYPCARLLETLTQRKVRGHTKLICHFSILVSPLFILISEISYLLIKFFKKFSPLKIVIFNFKIYNVMI